MARTKVKNIIHIIFHVKWTGARMQKEDLKRIFSYISGIIKGVGGFPIRVGGTIDHVHILTTLPKTIALSDFVRTIKAESSKWVKTLEKRYKRFAWQDGYGAFSVSQSMVNKTISYIENQDLHHTKQTFEDEYKAFLDAYAIDYDDCYIFN